MKRPSSGAVSAISTASATSCPQPASVIRTSRGTGAPRPGTTQEASRGGVRRCSQPSPGPLPGLGSDGWIDLVVEEVLGIVWPDDAVAAPDERHAQPEE